MNDSFRSISLVGFGNVGFHLAKNFTQIGVNVTHIVVRNTKGIGAHTDSFSCLFTDDFSELPKGQLTIICTPDDTIEEILNKIPSETPVAYTSGSVELDQLPNRTQLGVFYPLQTFSKNVEVDITSVPFLIESFNEEFQSNLVQLANKLSSKVSLANSEKRKSIHLSAVFVNNFTNHILHHAEEIASKHKFDFALLLPLLKETVRKIENDNALNSQTGPAVRQDQKTIDKHLSMLNEQQKKVYLAITESIKQTYTND